MKQIVLLLMISLLMAGKKNKYHSDNLDEYVNNQNNQRCIKIYKGKYSYRNNPDHIIDATPDHLHPSSSEENISDQSYSGCKYTEHNMGGKHHPGCTCVDCCNNSSENFISSHHNKISECKKNNDQNDNHNINHCTSLPHKSHNTDNHCTSSRHKSYDLLELEKQYISPHNYHKSESSSDHCKSKSSSDHCKSESSSDHCKSESSIDHCKSEFSSDHCCTSKSSSNYCNCSSSRNHSCSISICTCKVTSKHTPISSSCIMTDFVDDLDDVINISSGLLEYDELIFISKKGEECNYDIRNKGTNYSFAYVGDNKIELMDIMTEIGNRKTGILFGYFKGQNVYIGNKIVLFNKEQLYKIYYRKYNTFSNNDIKLCRIQQILQTIARLNKENDKFIYITDGGDKYIVNNSDKIYNTDKYLGRRVRLVYTIDISTVNDANLVIDIIYFTKL